MATAIEKNVRQPISEQKVFFLYYSRVTFNT